mgnify:FL=1
MIFAIVVQHLSHIMILEIISPDIICKLVTDSLIAKKSISISGRTYFTVFCVKFV